PKNIEHNIEQVSKQELGQAKRRGTRAREGRVEPRDHQPRYESGEHELE
ncbi:hypothetical protein A2U01_0098470, partial [Trifolium medium]|nr:hypothetical protein [Trifolium medium]